ncbi:rRNA maturation RNase YbeY [Casimicrobium huifangae]|jgi:probable rRNA maturation factor|uniref:rRNA maturation RNase YbeY n=1 Tax=Casimicrobium huifangae TaxID=2591109 RepID=UPI0012EB6E75|nr:rRNA maturation RNase YbeY [Casimicrobium huifangae]HOB01504.1 rRNA maturation RNase YbeY [Casimicrobium huifangae]HQA32952.1 rRNA maturation RNase YbeY [Casimicrobium huifangae]
MTLHLSVQFASAAAHLPSRAQVRRWALAAHAGNAGAGDGVVTIRYVDEKEGRALNRDFRGKDYATNVLTFVHEPLTSRAGSTVRHSSLVIRPAAQPYQADIAICAPVIAREAREQKKAVHDHHAHMVVHGMLHAQGFDHEDATEAAAMEAIEIAVLKRFRIKNPYETE